MSDSSATAAGLNTLLVGASGYALYEMSPSETPFAFAACLFGLFHGLLGLAKSVSSDDQNTKEMREATMTILELCQLPLINIELYMASDQSTSLAMGHGLFIVPLAGQLLAKVFGWETDEENDATLKDLTILGNIVSLTFLAVNEGNGIYGGMAATAFLTKYGSMLAESYNEGCLENCMLLGYSVFAFLTSCAVSGEPEFLKGKD